jgi:bifunctional enzyme CysN/CysC
VWALKHTTKTVRAMATALEYRLDVNTLHRDDEATGLTMNEIGRVRLRTTAPLPWDPTPATGPPARSCSSTRPATPTVGAGTLLDR